MKIHFVGISGIGISALAGYYLEKGNEITGSDLSLSETANELKKRGVKIFLGHKSSNLKKETDFLVYSSAVKKDNPEILESKKKGIKALSYPEALGNLTKEYYTVAFSGTHGKSTTTAMFSLIAIGANLDPTIIIGTKLKELKNRNYREGKSNLLIIESDEWNASFLKYSPDIAAINNIERDHLDYYKNLNHIIGTFKKYVGNVKRGGFLVLNKDDKNVLKLKRKNLKTIQFSLKQKEAGKIRKILKVPGEHNVYNALCALSASRAVGIEDKVSYKYLSSFRGTWRRFEEKKINGLTIINDYAHHPTAIKETLKAARDKFKRKRIWCIFQPHQIERTKLLFNDFVKVFSSFKAEKIIIIDIYDVPGREKNNNKRKVSSKNLVEKINQKNIIYLQKDKVKKYIMESISEIDVLIIMGAGDIYEFGKVFNTFNLTKKAPKR